MTKLGDELIKAAEEALEYHKKPECQHCNHYDELKADLDMCREALDIYAMPSSHTPSDGGYLARETLEKLK